MSLRLAAVAVALALLSGCPKKPKGDLPPLFPTTGSVVVSKLVAGGELFGLGGLLLLVGRRRKPRRRR